MRTVRSTIFHHSSAREKEKIPRAPRRLRWTAVGSVIAVTAGFAGAAVFAAPAQAAGPTIVSLTFDDANDDQVAAAGKLKAAGLQGTFFIPSGYLDAPGYMTSAQVQALQADGHEIGGHSVTHTDLVGVGPDEARRQVCNDRVNLTNLGLNVRNFAYPFASSSPEVQTIVQNCGYNSARGLGDVRGKIPESAALPAAETLPPSNVYETGAPEQVDNTWTLADLQNVVTQAGTDGGWIQLTLHHIGGDDPLSISDDLYTEYVNWLSAQQIAGAIEVKTVGDVIGGVTQPAVSGPAPPPPVTMGNLVQNPGLETAGPIAGLPKCWSVGGYGTNVPTFSQITPGRSGTVAEQLNMDGYIDGDAKLLPTMDLGECAPTVTAGQTYDLKAWYTSTGPTQFAVYIRQGLGSWSYWTSSPQINASTDWTQAIWTSPALPAGTTGLSFGLNLMSNGVLTTDDYELTRSGGAQTPSFTDVDESNQFYTEIGWLASNGITKGYPEGDFRPVYPVNRDAMAAFLYRFSGSPAYVPPATSQFSDVPVTNQFYKEISWLAQTGITTGYWDGTFRPYSTVNRDAMAAFLYRLSGSPTVAGSSNFSDVSAGSLFYKEITWLAQTGITTGFEDNTFRPHNAVNRDAMAAFLYRYNGLMPSAGLTPQ